MFVVILPEMFHNYQFHYRCCLEKKMVIEHNPLNLAGCLLYPMLF